MINKNKLPAYRRQRLQERQRRGPLRRRQLRRRGLLRRERQREKRRRRE